MAMTDAAAPKSVRTSPRDRVWAAIRKLGEFDMQDLWREARVNEDTTRGYLRCLLAAQPPYLQVVREAAGGRSRRFRLVRNTGARAPRLDRAGRPVAAGAAADNVWRSIRALRLFSAEEIAATATTKEATVSVAYARSYCYNLVRRGFLMRVPVEQGAPVRFQVIPTRCHAKRPPASSVRSEQ